MATIYDVARRAGVSPKTVSRVLNGDAPVSSQTRRRVAEAIDHLGYVPSYAARSIRSNRSGLIGLITGAISGANEVVAHAGLPELFLVQGAQRVIEASGKTLMISDTGGNPDRVPGLIRAFQEHRAEGLLYVANSHQKIRADWPGGSVPKVLVNCFDDAGTPAVLPDDKGGQLALTRAIVAQGHRRIAYLTLAPRLEATRLRLQGYKKALDEANIAYDAALVLPADLYGAPGEHDLIRGALDTLLGNPTPPTAICCGNDRLAMAVYGLLRDRGVPVPDQMSVVGYDDHRLISETLYPALTTAELPYAAMGAQAAKWLLDILGDTQGDHPDPIVRVPGALRLRGSLVAPHENENVINLSGRREV